MPISVILVDDHPIVRSGLRAVLDGRHGVEIVGEAATGEEAIALCEHLRPDVVLCDLRLGDGLDGIATTAALRNRQPPPAVLILTTFDLDAQMHAAFQAGASGYLLKDADPATIIDAITQAAAGGMYLPADLAARVLQGMRNPPPQLTAREAEVLRLLATGATNREISLELFVTEATVKSHLAHIFTKLDVDSRARAILVAQETGLV